jgi:hypothetical protein
MRCKCLIVACAFALVLHGGAAFAQAPTVTDPSATLQNDSANGGNFATGIILDERAFVSPSPTTSPTFGFMRQGSTGEALFTRPDSIHPNWVQASVPYSSALTGAWTLHVSSTSTFTAPTTTIVSTPAVGSSVGVMPFVQSMTITADSTGVSPMISWVLPTTGVPNDPTGNPMPSIDSASISISSNGNTITRTNIDPNSPNFGHTFQQANVIYSSGPLSASTTSFTVPTTNDNSNNANFGSPVLQFGQTYSIAIQLNHDNGLPAVPGCSLCSINSRSNSFFDYTPVSPASLGLPANTVINLPTTTPIPTTSGAFAGPVYSFNVANVGPLSTTYIDPLVANGFIYTVGMGDPNFATVQAITHVGNGIYQLLGWNGTSFIMLDSAFHAGDIFNFLTNNFPSGISKFEIVGIDPGVDPTDITAFVTGLTFVGIGSFTGTMEPIVVDTSATPLPAALPLFATGLGILGLIARRKRRVGKPLRP